MNATLGRLTITGQRKSAQNSAEDFPIASSGACTEVVRIFSNYPRSPKSRKGLSLPSPEQSNN